ncbi:hypothetical protein KCP69_25020 [Salmonella enterica subsp. enterica]|nr:hypothetical protein KCP69_25020 [Salmonella enterica subsp. enterica]
MAIPYFAFFAFPYPVGITAKPRLLLVFRTVAKGGAWHPADDDYAIFLCALNIEIL